jgi:hypothetical protein
MRNSLLPTPLLNTAAPIAWSLQSTPLVINTHVSQHQMNLATKTQVARASRSGAVSRRAKIVYCGDGRCELPQVVSEPRSTLGRLEQMKRRNQQKMESGARKIRHGRYIDSYIQVE